MLRFANFKTQIAETNSPLVSTRGVGSRFRVGEPATQGNCATQDSESDLPYLNLAKDRKLRTLGFDGTWKSLAPAGSGRSHSASIVTLNSPSSPPIFSQCLK
jgi:hypothetical protein